MDHLNGNDPTVLDLSKYSSTMPIPVDGEIDRSSAVNQLYAMAMDSRQPVVVVGSHGSGKTVLLSQFVRRFRERSISFFVGTDFWNTRPWNFLMSCCVQMQQLVPKYHHVALDEANQHELEDWFARLYAKVAKQGLQSGHPFIFVVDGIDRVPESYGQPSILTLMPVDPFEGVLFVGSCAVGTNLPFKCGTLPIPLLSQPETERYFAGILDCGDALRVHEASAGLPGYLAHVRQQLLSGTSPSEILTDPAQSLSQLYERDWQLIQRSAVDISDILALVAFSPEELSDAKLGSIMGLDEAAVRDKLAPVQFLAMDEQSGIIRFRSDSHKHFVSSKLQSYKHDAETKLVQHYEDEPSSPEARQHLPTLYRQTNEYDRLKRLVDLDYLVRTVVAERESDRVSGGTALRVLGDMAYGAEDWDMVAYSALAGSILATMSGEMAPLEAKVEALLAQRHYDDAVRLAFSSRLPADRLHMLSRICHRLHESGLSISGDIIDSLEQTLARLTPAPELRDKLFDAAANLFPVLPKLSVQVLERMVNDDENAPKEPLIDALLSSLLVILDSEERTAVDEIEGLIRDEALRDFARAASPLMTKLTASEVLEEGKAILDDSARLFLLRSWCNSNGRNPQAYCVVEEALVIMTQSSGYAPSMRELRQFAEPMIWCPSREIAEPVIHRIDLMKDTLVSSPADERCRLDLVLSQVEGKWSEDSAIARLYETYFSLESIRDHGIRCFILVHVLLSIHRVCPTDRGLLAEVRSELVESFNHSLADSAEQFKQHRRTIGALARYDVDLALLLASRLNTSRRRDKAYEEILRAYATQESVLLDANLVRRIIGLICEPSYREVATMRFLRSVGKRAGTVQIVYESLLFDMIGDVTDPSLRAYSAAYCVARMACASHPQYQRVAAGVLSAFRSIGDPVQKITTGFALCSIVASAAPELAKNLFDLAAAEELRVTLCNPLLSEMYRIVCDIAIRTVPLVCKGVDSSDVIDRLVSLVGKAASPLTRCSMLSSLGLRLHGVGDSRGFTNAAKACLEVLDSIEDPGIMTHALVESAPLVYEYERRLLDDRLGVCSNECQDSAYESIFRYILSGRPSVDPVDLRQLQCSLDPRSIERACEIISHVHSDQMIYHLIDTFVSKITSPIPNSRQPLRVDERHALSAADRLCDVIRTRLPDKSNISHDGYLIAAQAALCRVRSAASRSRPYRAGARWQALDLPSWGDLRMAAHRIPNTADRALVLTIVGEACVGDPSLARSILDEAADCVNDIENDLDRIERFCSLARAYNSFSEVEAAKYTLEQTLPLFSLMSSDEGADQLSSSIIEIAHSIAPDYGAALASRIDKPYRGIRAKGESRAWQLLADPARLSDDDNRRDAMELACSRILTSLCSRKSTIQPSRVIGKWINMARDHGLDACSVATAWLVENTVASHTGSTGLQFEEFLRRVIGLAELVVYASGVSVSSAVAGNDVDLVTSPAPSTRLHPILAGQRAEALELIFSWLVENGFPYTKVYDPYFSPQDIEILKSVPAQSHIHIITSWRMSPQKGKANDDLREEYLRCWSTVSAQLPPPTQVYLFGNPSTFRTPQHNRYIIAARGGLELGTSINGLGVSDSSIRVLDEDEKAIIEQRLVNPILCNPPSEFRGDKMELSVFSLR